MTASALVLFSAGQDLATCSWRSRGTSGWKPWAFSTASAMRWRWPSATCCARRWPARVSRKITSSIFPATARWPRALTADRAIEFAADGLPSTFVPGRNLVFHRGRRHRLPARARRAGGRHVRDGLFRLPRLPARHAGCAGKALSLGLDYPIRIETPLMRLSKAQTWALAHALAAMRSSISSSSTVTPATRAIAPGAMPGAMAANCPACDLRARGFQQWLENNGARAGGA